VSALCRTTLPEQRQAAADHCCTSGGCA
jgi:hypothetical protein